MAATTLARRLTRRQALATLAGLSSVALGALFGACRPLRQAPDRLVGWLATLPEARRQTLRVAIERIMPGAAEAGALAFIAYWLEQPGFAGFVHELDLLTLLLERQARQRFSTPFVSCTAAAQDEVLRDFQLGRLRGKHFDGEQAFRHLVALTLESYLGEPKYGGNQDAVGWQLIGHHACYFAPKHAQGGPPLGGLPY